jgi:acyl carrier protein
MAEESRPKDILKEVSNCIAESGVRWLEGFEMSSLDVITLAVKIEKHFNLQFHLNEITAKNFSSTESIAALVATHLNSRHAR